MAERISPHKRKRKIRNINIMESQFYAQHVILIALGLDNYKAIRAFRKMIEPKKSIPYASLNVQIGNLIDNGYIFDSQVSERNNKKIFRANWDKLAEHLWDHCTHLIKESILRREKYFTQGSGEPDLMLLDTLKATGDWEEAKQSAQWARESRSELPQTADNAIREIQDDKLIIREFLSKSLKDYLKHVPSNFLLEKDFKAHFDLLIHELICEHIGLYSSGEYKPKGRNNVKIAFFLTTLEHALRPLEGMLTNIMMQNLYISHSQESTKKKP